MFFKSSSSYDFLIVGLGNPGKKYENTRHNAGFIFIDKLCKKYNVNANKLKFKSLITDIKIGDKKALVMKPDTFMNLSGQAVIQAMNFYKIPPENVVIILDDVTLDVGKMRIRRKGSDGGQNGMKNIIYLSGSDNFPRIKIGVGKKPHPEYNLADWVLSSFSSSEQKELDKITDDAVNAVELIIQNQTDKAMNLFN